MVCAAAVFLCDVEWKIVREQLSRADPTGILETPTSDRQNTRLACSASSDHLLAALPSQVVQLPQRFWFNPQIRILKATGYGPRHQGQQDALLIPLSADLLEAKWTSGGVNNKETWRWPQRAGHCGGQINIGWIHVNPSAKVSVNTVNSSFFTRRGWASLPPSATIPSLDCDVHVHSGTELICDLTWKALSCTSRSQWATWLGDRCPSRQSVAVLCSALLLFQANGLVSDAQKGKCLHIHLHVSAPQAVVSTKCIYRLAAWGFLKRLLSL